MQEKETGIMEYGNRGIMLRTRGTHVEIPRSGRILDGWARPKGVSVPFKSVRDTRCNHDVMTESQ